jgi:hypothetical protein
MCYSQALPIIHREKVKKKEAEKHIYGVCICYETVTKVRCMQNESMTKPDAISGIFSLELQEHPPQ